MQKNDTRTIRVILEEFKDGQISIDGAEKEIESIITKSCIQTRDQGYVTTNEKDDYEFNLHRHWKDDDDDNYSGIMSRHFNNDY